MLAIIIKKYFEQREILVNVGYSNKYTIHFLKTGKRKRIDPKQPAEMFFHRLEKMAKAIL